MLTRSKNDKQGSLFFSLTDSIDQRHPLYILCHKVDWAMFEKAFSSLYCQDNGASANPIILMISLLILKHLRDSSDESIVEQWSENCYYQYFSGSTDFTPTIPCILSELVHFRGCIGELHIYFIKNLRLIVLVWRLALAKVFIYQ